MLRYDLRTKRFLGAFVPAGSGGLVAPIGMEFGPDGNLYVASSGTNAVLRYDGHTGAFIDQFVPPGTAGINSPHAINFGGPHSNLYVISTGNNQMVEFDRVTGAFVRVVATSISTWLVPGVLALDGTGTRYPSGPPHPVSPRQITPKAPTWRRTGLSFIIAQLPSDVRK